MNNVGLTQEQIIRMLGEKGILPGEPIKARALNEAIADIIVQNNLALAGNIPGLVAAELEKELNKSEMFRNI